MRAANEYDCPDVNCFDPADKWQTYSHILTAGAFRKRFADINTIESRGKTESGRKPQRMWEMGIEALQMENISNNGGLIVDGISGSHHAPARSRAPTRTWRTCPPHFQIQITEFVRYLWLSDFATSVQIPDILVKVLDK